MRYHLTLISLMAFMFVCASCDDETSTSGNQAGETTAGETTAGETTAGETTAGEATAGETTAGEATAGEVTAGEVTAGEVTAGEVTAGETTAGDATAGDMMQPQDSSNGSMPSSWDKAEHCVASITRDFSVVNDDGEEYIRLIEGTKYLLKTYTSESFEMYYFTDGGAKNFEVDLAEGETLPFESNCEASTFDNYLGVFADTIVYRDEAMTEVACELAEGTSTLGGIGFAIRAETFQTAFYKVFGRGLVALCDGLEEGYVDMVDIEIWEDRSDRVIPINNFMGVDP